MLILRSSTLGCIDKRSSAELSEAINSMYQWYRESRECYAFLRDVLSAEDAPNAGILEHFELPFGKRRCVSFQTSLFSESEWFKRAWTVSQPMRCACTRRHNDPFCYIVAGTSRAARHLVFQLCL